MKKPKTTGVTLSPPHLQPYSLHSSHQNDDFNPSPVTDTLRFSEDRDDHTNDDEERPAEGDGVDDVEEDDEDEGDDDDDDDDDEGEDEYEDDDDGEEEDGDGDERDVGYDAMAAAMMATTTAERKKLADGFFEVEFIRRKRICKGERQYLIKWRGWPESANTWEPVDHLQTCPDVVEAFEESLRSGQKKMSRKRKRKFTQPKKKMQYSYGASKKNGDGVKRPRAAKNADGKGSEAISPHLNSNEKENGDPLFDQKSSGKDSDMHLQQPMTIEGDGQENCQSSANCVEEGGQNNQRRGAKRRKSGSVRRFTQDMTSFSFDYFANAPQVNISSGDRVNEFMLGNSDGYHKKKFDNSRSSTVITRLIKPISYSASVTNNVHDVSVTFVAMRSDGKEVMVDNKFLKANNPNLLINFYEQHLRYSPN